MEPEHEQPMKQKAVSERLVQIISWLIVLAFPLFFLFVFIRMIVRMFLGVPFDSY